MNAHNERLKLAQENVDFWEMQSMHDFEETICFQAQGAAVEYMFSAEAYRLSSRRYREARDEVRALQVGKDQPTRDLLDRLIDAGIVDAKTFYLETHFDDDEPEDT